MSKPLKSNHPGPVEYAASLEEYVTELEAENKVLRVAFTKKNDEYTMVLGCISTWVEKLPRELKTAIREGQFLAAPFRAEEGRE